MTQKIQLPSELSMESIPSSANPFLPIAVIRVSIDLVLASFEVVIFIMADATEYSPAPPSGILLPNVGVSIPINQHGAVLYPTSP